MKRKAASRWNTERGQSLVEFALVLPLFLMLLLGVAEFGRAWMVRNVLTGAAREAARIVAVQGDSASAQARANELLASAGIRGATVLLDVDGAPFGPCRATVSFDFPVTVAGFLPGLGRAALPLSASALMRKEY